MPELLDASAEANAQTPRTNAAGRLLAVLDAFGPRNRALSLSEISRRSGLSLSTAHRLVHELVSWGALERDPNGCYSIGVRLLELAALAPRGRGPRAGRLSPAWTSCITARAATCISACATAWRLSTSRRSAPVPLTRPTARRATAGHCTPPAPAWSCWGLPTASCRRGQCGARWGGTRGWPSPARR